MSQGIPPNGNYQQPYPYQQPTPPQKPKKKAWFWVLIGVASLIGLLVLLFIIAVIIGLAQGTDNEEVGATNSTSAPAPTQSTSSPTEETSTVPEETPEAEQQDVSARGNAIIEIGEEAGATTAGGENIYTLTVTGVEADPVCTNPSSANFPSENGHFLKVDVDIQTSDAESMNVNYGDNNLYTGGWKLVDENGKTVNGDLFTAASFSCVPESERIPSTVGPGENVSGAVILDVPSTQGTLIFEDNVIDGAVEWEIPKQ